MSDSAASNLRRAPAEEPSRDSWEEFLGGVAGAGPFHLPEWRRALLSTHPSLRDRTLWIEQGGRIRAALPALERPRFGLARVSSMSYGTPGGVWLRDPGDRDAAVMLLSEFSRLHARPWNDCIVVDHRAILPEAWVAQAWPSARARPGETHALDLPPSEDALEALWERRTRKACRRAASLGVTVERCAEGEGTAEFESFHEREGRARRMRFRYPASLLLAGERQGWLAVWRARREGRTLAVTAVTEGFGTLFLWLVAHAPEAREVPSGEILFGEILRDGVRRGLGQVDFGSSGGREGPRFFKEGFGARPRAYRVWRSGPLAGGAR